MKLYGLTLIAALAMGCSGTTPTSPSVGGTTPAIAGTEMSGRSEQKVTLHFFSESRPQGALHHIQNLPVTIETQRGEYLYYCVDHIGNVTFRLPATDDRILVSTAPWDGFCAIPETQLLLPLSRPSGGEFVLTTVCTAPAD